jgi:hypothetical protein
MGGKIRKGAFCIFVITISFVCIGWVSANYGSILPDSTVTKAFEDFRMDPDTNYYYSGSDVCPNAIMGLKKSHVLDTDLWKPIGAQPDVFKSMITGMRAKVINFGAMYGFLIRDNKGQPIGVWYSLLKARTFVQMGKGNKVIVYTPDLITYEGDFKGSGSEPGTR